MGKQYPQSVESRLLCQIRELAELIQAKSYVQSYPTMAQFPIPGVVGTLYVDESTGNIYVWNGTSYNLLSTGITVMNALTASAQFLVTGNGGSDFNIVSSGTTHTFNIPTASSTKRGLLSSIDWTTFNNKQDTLSLTILGNSGPATLVSSTLNIPEYTLSGLGGVPSSRTLTINGTTFDLSADRSWNVGTVTSVSALTIGTTGTDITSTVSNGTTTPVITLNIPTASAINRGALSSTDWTTFSNKQNAITLTTTGTSGAATLVGSTLNIPQYQTALTNPVTGTGTVNYIPKWTSSSAIGNSSIFDNGNVGINNLSPLALLHVGDRNSTGSTDPLILASRTINSGSGNSRGFSDSTNYARSGGTSYASYDARIDMTGTNNFGHYAAFQSGPTLNFTGTITDVFNYVSSPTYTAGTVTNSYGTYVQNPVKTGATLTNNYGHFFPSVFNAGTNNWVWYNSSTERSYSAGDTISRRFFAGSNSVAIPSAQFHADGTGDIKLRLQQSGFNYWDFTSVSGTTYATIGDVSGTYMTFFNLGNVALGTTTNNGYKLDVQGSLRNTTSAYFATTSGNVGIGTTSPTQKLTVLDGSISINSSALPGEVVRFTYPTTSRFRMMIQGVTAFDYGTVSSSSYGTMLVRDSYTNSFPAYSFLNDDNTGFSNANGTSDTLTLITGGNERVRIDSIGNVGIGGTPTSKFHIFGGSTPLFGATALIDADIETNNSVYNGTLALQNTSTPAGDASIRFGVYGHAIIRSQNQTTDFGGRLDFYTRPSDASAPVERMTISTTGNVGIGTASPLARLHVLNSTSAAASLTAVFSLGTGTGGHGAAIGFSAEGIAGTVKTGIGNIRTGGYDVSDLVFYANNSATSGNFTTADERMRITSTGNVGINAIPSVNDTLIVNALSGDTRFRLNRAGVNQIIINHDASVGVFRTESNTPLALGTNGTERLRIFANGNVGIGTTTDAGYKLDVIGDVRSSIRLIANGNLTPASWITNATTVGYSSSGTYGWITAGGASGYVPLALYGNVGIGTTTPTNTLDVAGTLRSTLGANFATTSGNVGVGTTSPGSKLDVNGIVNTNNYYLASSSQTFLGDNGIINGAAADGNTQLKYFASKDFYINEGGSTRMIVKTGGNVGIGTTTPQQKFVVSNAGAEGVEFVPGASSNSNQILSYNRSTSAYSDLVTRASIYNIQIGTSSAMYINASSNIGINRTNPSYKFDLLTSTDGFDGYNVNNNNAGLNAISGYRAINGNGIGLIMGVTEFSASSAMGGANQSVIYSVGTQNLMFGTNSTERMRINSAGAVGIGGISPVNELEVYGNNQPRFSIRAAESILESLEIGFQFGTGANSSTNTLGLIRAIPTQVDPNPLIADLVFSTNSGDSNTEKMRITGAGNVGIGGAPSFNLDILSSLPQMRLNSTSGTDASLYRAQNSGGTLYVGLDNSTGSSLSTGAPYSANIYHSGAYPIIFSTNSIQRMRIFGSGNVAIGSTTDSGKKLAVTGDIKVFSGVFAVNDTGTGDGLTISHSGSNVMNIQQNNNAVLNISTGGPSGDIVFNPNSSGAMRITGSGGVRIIPRATAPTPAAGTLYYDSTTNKLKLYDGTSWVDLN
jgi:hypothetical protein